MERPDSENYDLGIDASATTLLPAPHADINLNGSVVTGTTVPNANVTIYDGNGDPLGTGTSDANGNFTVSISPHQNNGERCYAVARDTDGKESYPGHFQAYDIHPPEAPTGEFARGYYDLVTGSAEPGSTVTVLGEDGMMIGTATAGPDGLYTVELMRDANFGEKLVIAATDASGNTSTSIYLTRPAGTDPCFLAGTMILTPQGEVAVQDLKVGDLVLSREGEAVPVLWIGTRKVRTAQKRSVDLPVSIRAGALGEGLPHSDLRLSPDHAVVLDELLINAGALRNGETVFALSMQELGAEFTYYHIETRNHEEILANGLVVETFIDYVSRSAFDNYAEYLALHGADRIIKEMQRPRIASARNLPASLQDRLGHTPSRLEDDVDHLLSARAG